MNVSPLPDEEPILWKQIIPKAVHDMRTPLSTMRTSIEILRALAPDSDQHRKVMGILEAQVGLITDHLETLLVNPGLFLSSKVAAEE